MYLLYFSILLDRVALRENVNAPGAPIFVRITLLFSVISYQRINQRHYQDTC